MNSNTLLKILGKERTRYALDEILMKSDSYAETERRAVKAHDHARSLGLNKKQRLAVDRVVSAYTQVGTEYGMTAYQLGVGDGVKLLLELIDSSHI